MNRVLLSASSSQPKTESTFLKNDCNIQWNYLVLNDTFKKCLQDNYYKQEIMIRKTFTVISLIIILSSCAANKEVKTDINLERKNEVKFKVEEVSLPDSVTNPILFHVVRDSILIIENIPVDIDGFHHIEFFNLLTGKKLYHFGKPGRGPGEWLSCRINSADDQEIIVKSNPSQQKCAVVNLDSVLIKGYDYQPSSIKIPKYTDNIIRLNKDYLVASNTHFVRDEKFRIPGMNRLFKIPIYKDTAYLEYDEEVKIMTANVSQMKLLSHEKADRIMALEFSTGRIEVFDKNLNFIKMIMGPDFTDFNYESHKGFGLTVPGERKEFIHGYGLPESVYVTYGNEPDLEKPTPTEIFQLDWEGNVIKVIKPEIPAFYIYGNNNNIFASCWEEEASLKRILF